jgi:hypothetical protein
VPSSWTETRAVEPHEDEDEEATTRHRLEWGLRWGGGRVFEELILPATTVSSPNPIFALSICSLQTSS